MPIQVEDGQIKAGEMVVEVDICDAEEPLTKAVSIDVQTSMTWPATGKVESRQVEVSAEEARDIWIESLPDSLLGDWDFKFTSAPDRRFRLESRVMLPQPTFLDRRLSFKELKEFDSSPEILTLMADGLGVPEHIVRDRLIDPAKQVSAKKRRWSRFGGAGLTSTLGQMDLAHQLDVPVSVIPLFQSQLEPSEWDPWGTWPMCSKHGRTRDDLEGRC